MPESLPNQEHIFINSSVPFFCLVVHQTVSISTLSSALESIQKYITNLLRPKRPAVWRSIKTDSPWFSTHVGCIQGAREVIKLIGYSEERGSSLEFPSHVSEPNKERLYLLMAELVMAKEEVDMREEGGEGRTPQCWQAASGCCSRAVRKPASHGIPAEFPGR